VRVRLVTVAELADYFGVSERKVRTLLHRNVGRGFPAFKVGNSWRIDFDRMPDWILDQLDTANPGRIRTKN
jgi:excisionase family DNA binding protein